MNNHTELKTWTRGGVRDNHEYLAACIRSVTPTCLHLGDAPERYLRDKEDADEDFLMNLKDMVFEFVEMWDEIYGSNEG